VHACKQLVEAGLALSSRASSRQHSICRGYSPQDQRSSYCKDSMPSPSRNREPQRPISPSLLQEERAPQEKYPTRGQKNHHTRRANSRHRQPAGIQESLRLARNRRAPGTRESLMPVSDAHRQPHRDRAGHPNEPAASQPASQVGMLLTCEASTISSATSASGSAVFW
jgi:hypothetical protein